MGEYDDMCVGTAQYSFTGLDVSGCGAFGFGEVKAKP